LGGLGSYVDGLKSECFEDGFDECNGQQALPGIPHDEPNETEIHHLPVDQHATTSFDGSIDETIALREMLEQVLIVDIINFDGHMREPIEQTLLDRQLQHGKNMCDTCLAQRLFATKGEQSIGMIRLDISFWGGVGRFGYDFSQSAGCPESAFQVTYPPM
jgi:hypothetical protein